ncbi:MULTISPECIES: PTS lactose/cellobiose transporter subunit IIA [Clostridium]|uniref:PTS lactose/cellobiose transporter subunit IIA n=1 Tax=Clostridium TaxID=1485 RepID=UPI00082705C4|nr:MULTISPECIES: PTS lactose/cellobiose transporter subunit IIA [Clostridium]PJI06802.1 PTS lactose/cellobiose transporter subunit IIA [Clostridium sp. CT7]
MEDSEMIALEIIGSAGDARSKLVLALDECNNNNFKKAETLMAEANELIQEAHNVQTKMLQAEASGDKVDICFLMVHAQDHLMTTILLRDVIKSFVNLYKRTSK